MKEPWVRVGTHQEMRNHGHMIREITPHINTTFIRILATRFLATLGCSSGAKRRFRTDTSLEHRINRQIAHNFLKSKTVNVASKCFILSFAFKIDRPLQLTGLCPACHATIAVSRRVLLYTNSLFRLLHG